MISDKARAALATAYRIQLEVIMIDLALRFPQDGLKVAWRENSENLLPSHSWLGSCAKLSAQLLVFAAGNKSSATPPSGTH
ncbi:MAG TPA: hypothetical protein VGH55_05010 [Chthoniobacterales bacterium]|jgi:hypothetical protein